MFHNIIKTPERGIDWWEGAFLISNKLKTLKTLAMFKIK